MRNGFKCSLEAPVVSVVRVIRSRTEVDVIFDKASHLFRHEAVAVPMWTSVQGAPTYLHPVAWTAAPCWTRRRAPCTLRRGTGILPCQRGMRRPEPARSGYSGGTRTGSCAEQSTAAADRSPASCGARSGCCRSSCLWMRTPAGSGSPWWSKWSSQPRWLKASSPRKQVKIARSFSPFFFALNLPKESWQSGAGASQTPLTQQPGCPPWRRPTQLELVITGRAELSQAGQDRREWMPPSHWLACSLPASALRPRQRRLSPVWLPSSPRKNLQ